MKKERSSLYSWRNSSSSFIFSHNDSTKLKSFKHSIISSKLGKSPSCNLGYITLSKIAKFSIAWVDITSTYAISIVFRFAAYNPFKTVEIAVEILKGESNIKGFKPGEFISLGSIKFTGIL